MTNVLDTRDLALPTPATRAQTATPTIGRNEGSTQAGMIVIVTDIVIAHQSRNIRPPSRNTATDPVDTARDAIHLIVRVHLRSMKMIVGDSEVAVAPQLANGARQRNHHPNRCRVTMTLNGWRRFQNPSMRRPLRARLL